MKIAVRYYTKSGNTKKLAEAIAEVVGAEALDITHPVNEDTDILFLGSSVYAHGVAKDMKRFISELDPYVVKRIVNFSSAALIDSTYPQMQKLTSEAGLILDTDEFHCKGQFLSVHKGKPDEKDLKAAADFARQYIQRIESN